MEAAATQRLSDSDAGIVVEIKDDTMIAQYTSAALVNEIAGLASPASVINLPTSAGIEDYNSFGPRSAAKAARAIELTESVVAIEMICAAEGVEFHRPLKSGPAVEEALRRIRAVVPSFSADRSPAPAIEAVSAMIRDDAFGDIFDFTIIEKQGE